jgi:hypothetical protein
MIKEKSLSYMLEIQSHLNKIDEICKRENMGDIFSYSKVKEVLMASHLGHTVPKDYSGADAYNKFNKPVEYKSTISKNINGTYNGISVQSSWEAQLEYLETEKIGKYPEHYYGRFNGTVIEEIWKVDSKDVLDILIPKLKRDYDRKTNPNSKHKDPRLSGSISKREIYKYGTQIL